MRDLIIIGGGPAGITAGIYATRKNLDTLLITKDFIGQTGKAGIIENWPGNTSITGPELMTLFRDHLEIFRPEISEGEVVISMKKVEDHFVLETDVREIETRAIIIASGRNPRQLSAEGVEKFVGKGVSYCATCDVPLFAGKTVAVVGGGNSGFETAIEMAERNAPKVYLLEMAARVLADEILQNKVSQLENIEVITKVVPQRIDGDLLVKSLTYKELDSGAEKTIDVEGVFVEIGSIPVANFVKDLADCNEKGEIIIDQEYCSTKTPGLFAAGDVTDIPYKQIVIAAGEGSKAALSAYNYIKR